MFIVDQVTHNSDNLGGIWGQIGDYGIHEVPNHERQRLVRQGRFQRQ